MPHRCRLSLLDLRQQLLSRDISATSLVEECLQMIHGSEPALKALLYVCEKEALAEAAALDQAGPDPKQPLWGIPVVVKDVLATKGIPTTCGSRILENFIPPYDAQVITKLKQAGAIILAKANMDEFAMGSSTENSAYQVTHNPWDLSRVPGGSSGGSAASVAAGQAPASLGTDTGGSIRQPAAFCGIVGMKPTYGRVSRFGLVAYGSSLDQIGPMTRTVADNALMLQVIAGHDSKDSTSADIPVPDYLACINQNSSCRGLRLGVPTEYWGKGMDPEVEGVCRQALDQLKDLGATLVPVSMPHTSFGIAAYYIIAMAEASSNLARFDGVKYGLRDQSASDLAEMYAQTRSLGFGEEVQRRIMLGTYVLSSGYYDAYYKKAAQIRRLIRRDFDQALSQCDLLCAPVSPTTAFPIGAMNSDPLTMYLMDIYTITLNLAGLPGLAMPVGRDEKSGLPVGIQFFGPAFGEEKLYSLGHVLERNLPALPWPKALADSA